MSEGFPDLNTGAVCVLDLWIPGEPASKERPRRGANGAWYTPQATKDAESRIGWLARSQYKGKPLAGEVRIHVHFAFGTRRRKDEDNCLKLAQDALNKIVWQDDSQVADTRITRVLGAALPGTRIRVWAL